MSQINNDLPLTLVIVTPEGALPQIRCESITLTVKDNEKGKGGGSYGIRKGHTNSLIATDKGEVRAFINGEKVFSVLLSEGFAGVDKNTVTITANKL
ncbi:MAG: hypothetical protein IKL10_05940 [Clostridia bacterium]|nr:hypothetical protein [Clostridia bacterium]